MNRPRVLLADDHGLLLEAFEKLLEPQCEVVGKVSNGRELLTVAPELEPDVVVLDISMPQLNGLDAGRHLKKMLPDVKLIYLTVHEDRDLAEECMRMGASGYLLKTEPAERIIKAIEEIRRGGAPMNAQIARRVLNMFTQMITPAYDYDLSDREKEILELMVESLSKDQIAGQLFLSPHTVDTHIKNIYAKLHVHSRSAAVAKALKERLI